MEENQRDDIVKTKKQKDQAAMRDTLIRIMIAGILFLAVYLIAEFEPSFIPFHVRDIKEAIASNLFDFIK